MNIEVTTQAQLDKALKTLKDGDLIVCKGSGSFKVTDSATVWAYDSATVWAYDSATVSASDSATVTAYGSARVTASGSARVTASDSATVWAYGSARVTASGSARVTASDSATVSASGSARVTASDSARVTASDSARVTAGSCVAVHKKSKHTTITGGVVIEVPDLSDKYRWLDYYGIQRIGVATVKLYKAVGADGKSDHGVDYSPGCTPVATDFAPTNACGGGLHLGPSPRHAKRYASSATRFICCVVEADSIVPITEDGTSDKCKVERVLSCVEVDEFGDEIPS